MKKLLMILMMIPTFLILISCGQKEKGTLTVYVGLYEDHAIRAIEAFEKETGIKVSHVRMSNGEILAKIRAEKDAPKASVWFGGPSDTFVQAKMEGLLQPYFSANEHFIPEIYKDEEGYWTGIYVGSIALVSNRAWLQEVGLHAPNSWQDLLKPQYKGMVSMADPRSSGTAYTVLATLVQLMGEEEAFRYLEQLDQNVRTYTTSGSVPGRSVGMGESGVAIMFAHDALKFFKEGFRDLIITFPKEGTGYEIGAVGMVNGAPNEEEAKIFIDWSLTKQAQELGKQMGNYQLLTNETAISPEEAFYLTEINTIVYDQQWAGESRSRLIERWYELVN
ncbi:iron ABC transporter substrate-binding protein [Anaerobacillus alkalidiazotrophicus]|uniref:Iron ABC transporter substrate-binding protein n=1 Tax=Anaerobacillus alkalidiazotrophicus TaxID=472963 RepID=A0A1S2M5Y9_9BACI|nr:ABC transporter substrate-binding protein [Anaerobacillus alkalidiazotrophicus]OIJ20178.1 iron ABC transporter substrate-binding protein [Anaerobacillus alkalidiazotrophicus]